MRVRVKICGITRREDAVVAVELGADALGFVLWPGSARAINSDRARAIVEAVPKSVTRVGVFVDPLPADVAWLVRAWGWTPSRFTAGSRPKRMNGSARPS
jgi:phosphoribosylanthranilate isomerase